MELTVISPCFNEADNLPALVGRVGRCLAAERRGFELILVDDGSRDETGAVIERLRAEHGFVRAARHARNEGLAAAWATGLSLARGRLVCLLDADLQYRPEDIPRLAALLDATGCDIAQGARSPTGRARDARFAISRALNGMLNALFGMDLADNKSGFVLCRREVLADLLADRGGFRYFQVLLLVAAHARGYTIRAVEAPFDDRRAGRSAFGSLPIATSARVLVDLGRGVLRYRLGIS